MIRRFVSTPAVTALAAAAILAATPSAPAQSFYSGGGRPTGGFSPGFNRGFPAYSGNSFQPHVGLYGYQGNFRSYAPYAITNYGSYQPFGSPFYGIVQGNPAAAAATPAVPNFGGMRPSAAAPSGNVTRLTVRVPADAQLWVDNYQPPLSGPVRVMTTPPLQTGQGYHYTVRAQWTENGRPVNQQRTVHFRAGGDVTVDFTRPAPPATPPASPVTPPVNPANPPA